MTQTTRWVQLSECTHAILGSPAGRLAAEKTSNKRTALFRLVNQRNIEGLCVDGDLEEAQLLAVAVEHALQPCDVVINVRSTPLRAAVVGLQGAGALPGQNLAVLRPGHEVEADYLAAVLRSRPVRSELEQMYTGTAQKLLPLKALQTLIIPLPPIETQRRLAAAAVEVDRLNRLAAESIEARRALLDAAFEAAIEPPKRGTRA